MKQISKRYDNADVNDNNSRLEFLIDESDILKDFK